MLITQKESSLNLVEVSSSLLLFGLARQFAIALFMLMHNCMLSMATRSHSC